MREVCPPKWFYSMTQRHGARMHDAALMYANPKSEVGKIKPEDGKPSDPSVYS